MQKKILYGNIVAWFVIGVSVGYQFRHWFPSDNISLIVNSVLFIAGIGVVAFNLWMIRHAAKIRGEKHLVNHN